MNINYELAKELKEAGFPLSPDIKGKYERIRQVDSTAQIQAYYPTLSQLIEACGEKFDSLEKGYGEGWLATGSPPKSETTGTTPEEAVARLWLALHT